MKLADNCLKELHQLHQRLFSLRERIEKGPKQIAARRAHLATRSEEVGVHSEELKAMKISAGEKELQSKSLALRINDLQVKINSAKSNKEYSLLVTERDTAKSSQEKIDDELLEGMLHQDEKSKEVSEAEAEINGLEQELESQATAVFEECERHKNALSECEIALKEAEAALPVEMKDVYNRLLNSLGPEALSEAKSNNCMGCYTSITPQMANELLANSVVLCKSCGRILYLAD